MSIVCHNKKVRHKIDFYILHTVSLLIILLIIAIICYHYANHRSKQKNIGTLTTKMENNEFKTVCMKNRMCYFLDGIINLEDFDLMKF